MKITLETPLKIREKTYNKLLNELQSWAQTCKASALKKYTVGSTGINACGDVPFGTSMKQEYTSKSQFKLRLDNSHL